MAQLGLFPLPLVLVPTERIPLHIFEPRYKELISECIARGEEFGLVLDAGDGAVHEVGTRAAVADVLEELPDGRMNIVVEGGDRFRLIELTSGRPFTTAAVEDVIDSHDPAEADETARALDLFRELADAAGAEVDIPSSDSPLLDFELAARVDFGVEAKQDLLASTSPRERMAKLVALLGTALEALRPGAAPASDRASGNGKVAAAGRRGLALATSSFAIRIASTSGRRGGGSGGAGSLRVRTRALVERDRRPLCGKTCSSSFVIPSRRPTPPPPRAMRVPMPAPAVAARDHQAEIGDVRARRVRVARDREPSDESPSPSTATSSAAGMAPRGANVAALVADAPPPVVGEQPSLRLAADGACERDEGGARPPAPPRARGCRVMRDDDTCAAAPWIARRGERALRLDLDGRRAAEEQVATPPPDDVVSRAPRAGRALRVEPALAVDVRLVDVDARRRDRGVDAEPVLQDVDDDLHDRAAKPGARAADDERGRPCCRARSTAPSCSSGAARAAPSAPTRSYSPSMLFRWIPVPGTITPDRRPGRR